MAMKTTVEIDQDNLKELMALLGIHTKTEAINKAIRECLKAYKRSRLLGLAGRVQIAEDWREFRNRDRRS